MNKKPQNQKSEEQLEVFLTKNDLEKLVFSPHPLVSAFAVFLFFASSYPLLLIYNLSVNPIWIKYIIFVIWLILVVFISSGLTWAVISTVYFLKSEHFEIYVLNQNLKIKTINVKNIAFFEEKQSSSLYGSHYEDLQIYNHDDKLVIKISSGYKNYKRMKDSLISSGIRQKILND